MKTPRIHDFDPDAKIPELNSPLDGMPAIQKPHPRLQHSIPVQETRQEQQQIGRDVRPVLPVLPKKRVMRQRHPFDIYQDQYESLRELAAEERKQGGAGSMSAMAREALDTYFKSKRRAGK